MSSSHGINKKDARKNRAFLVLIVTSLAYLIVFLFLLVKTKTCTPDASIMPQWLGQFFPHNIKVSELGIFERFLSCITINELGDSLAGAFAPIAFLWLAGAVYIQSQELKAQREELTDTRAVMKEQVAETRASTRLFSEQTEILKKEQLLREQKEADHEFDAKITVALDMCFDIEELSIHQTKTSKEQSAIQFSTNGDDTIFKINHRSHENFRDLLKEILAGSIKAIQLVENTPIKDGFFGAGQTKKLQHHSQNAENI
jgi:hypothetical protein